MSGTGSSNQFAHDIACAFCGTTTLNIFPVEGGRNSRIYRVEDGGKVFALKFFRPDNEGQRQRFDAETTALSLFAEYGIEETPRVIAKDRVNNCVLMEWIEAERVNNYGEVEINALISFIQKVHKIASKAVNQKIRYATEACLNGDEIIKQINLRLSRLEASKGIYPELREFIDNKFLPALDEILNWSQQQYKKSALNFHENISLKQQTLSVVDFGFHNVLRKQNKFYFLDFEFFGWDDPVKLVADTLQHPGMALDDGMKQILFSGLKRIFDSDNTFLLRFKFLYPLFGLKWCTIMLNQFLPGYQSATQSAVANDKQLERVTSLTKSIYEDFQGVQYGNKYSQIC